MFADKYQEHMDSQPDNSRWDGFDRGDSGRTYEEMLDQGQRVIGRMTSGGGYRVTITEFWCDDLREYEVAIDGHCVHTAETREQAVIVARWWMDGCPA